MNGITELSKGETWQNRCPLRFVVKNGKYILQSPHQCLETGEVKWCDVPFVKAGAT